VDEDAAYEGKVDWPSKSCGPVSELTPRPTQMAPMSKPQGCNSTSELLSEQPSSLKRIDCENGKFRAEQNAIAEY